MSKRATKPDVLLSETQAGEQLGVSKYTIRRLRQSRDLAYVKVRGQVRIPSSSVERYVAARIVDGAA